MSVEDKKRLGRRFFKGYTKLVESKYWYNHYVALIFGASPASNLGSLIAIDWKGNELISVTRFFGNNDNVKLYLGSNPETNMYELWLGLIGLDGDGSEFIIQSRESIDLDSKTVETLPSYLKVISISWQKNNDFSELGELIGIATSNKSGLMSPKLYCAIPNSYVVNGATELKGKYVKIISVNDWSGSIINVKVSNYGNGSYFYIILCLATNNIVRWVSGKLIAGNISGFSFYRVDKSIYMFIPDSIQDLYVTLDASMGNVSYGKEYENTIDLSNPITISWHNSLSTLDLGELIGTASAEKDGLMGKEYTIRYIYNAGLSISYDVNRTSFYSTTSLIELFLYSTGSVAYYRILATPNKNIIIRYLGNNDCDFKLNGNILYVLPRHTDITIKYKIGLYRNDIPDFATISISDFANITGNIITPTAG